MNKIAAISRIPIATANRKITTPAEDKLNTALIECLKKCVVPEWVRLLKLRAGHVTTLHKSASVCTS